MLSTMFKWLTYSKIKGDILRFYTEPLIGLTFISKIHAAQFHKHLKQINITKLEQQINHWLKVKLTISNIFGF